MAVLDAEGVKELARSLGADLVGIASAKTLNAFPPDPLWPQTPDRISESCKSVIVIVSRIPVAAFRAKSGVAVQYMDMMVLRRMDKIAYKVVQALEAEGHPAFVTAAQETDWDMKKASYGRLSTRHLGIEAGLGTFGLEVNILTPEFGPRVYLTGILTDLELEPDEIMTEQVCIGESCSRCLLFLSDRCGPPFRPRQTRLRTRPRRNSASFGVDCLHAERLLRRPIRDDQESACCGITRHIFGLWQGLLRVAGSFGDCPRCHGGLPRRQRLSRLSRRMRSEADTGKNARESGQGQSLSGRSAKMAGPMTVSAPGLDDWNMRWVGPDGYQGIVARQLQGVQEAETGASVENADRQCGKRCGK